MEMVVLEKVGVEGVGPMLSWRLSGIGGKASRERETGVQLGWLDQLKAQVGLLPPP